MANQHPRLNFTNVELAHNIQVQTSLPPSCHAALRAGFAGYTDNPRWTPQKRRAWKQGKHWRSELLANLIEIKDGLLLTQETLDQASIQPVPQAPLAASPQASKTNFFHNLLSWSRKKPAMN